MVVADKHYYTEDEFPYPLDQIKSVIRKATEDDEEEA